MFSVIFPGQGSQMVGMGKEFYDKFDLVKNFFNEADEILNFSLSKLILEGPKEELELTANTQPAIFLISYSIFNVIQNEFKIDLNKAKYFAGHSLGEYSAPFSYVVSQMKKSNEELLKQIKDIEPNFDSSNFSNPEELMQNIPQLNNFDMESMLDVIFAPLSFYRSIIKYLAKNTLDILDPSVIDLVMDLGLVSNQGPTSDFEIKISKYDEASDSFIEFLNKSSNQLSLHEIIADINLIPTVDELNDPISWAARTSLPPI